MQSPVLAVDDGEFGVSVNDDLTPMAWSAPTSYAQGMNGRGYTHSHTTEHPWSSPSNGNGRHMGDQYEMGEHQPSLMESPNGSDQEPELATAPLPKHRAQRGGHAQSASPESVERLSEEVSRMSGQLHELIRQVQTMHPWSSSQVSLASDVLGGLRTSPARSPQRSVHLDEDALRSHVQQRLNRKLEELLASPNH